MRRKNSNVKIAVIIFAIIYFSIGVTELIQGADKTSRFFFYDNIVVRVLGGLFVVSSIGVLLKKKLAYKLLVLTALLSIIEAIITYDMTGVSRVETVGFIIFILIIYIPPMVSLSSMPFKRYFNIVSDEEYEGDSSEDSHEEDNIKLPQSKLGIASFVLAIISIVLFIIAISIILSIDIYGSEELSIVDILAFIFLFINMLTSFVGVGLGIAGAVVKKTKKVYSILGICLNSVIALFYIAVIIFSISAIKEQQYQFGEINSVKYIYSQVL